MFQEKIIDQILGKNERKIPVPSQFNLNQFEYESVPIKVVIFIFKKETKKLNGNSIKPISCLSKQL